jgi:hypothetical protein
VSSDARTARIEGEWLAQFCANRFVRLRNQRGFVIYFSAPNAIAAMRRRTARVLLQGSCVIAAFAIVRNKSAEKKHFRCDAFKRTRFVGERACDNDASRLADCALPVCAAT